MFRHMFGQPVINNQLPRIRVVLLSIPVMMGMLFVASVVCINLVANKTLMQLEWIVENYKKL